MLMNIICIVLVLLTLLVVAWYYRYWHFERYLKHIPGVRPLPIIGNAWDFQNSEEMIPILFEYQRLCNGGNFKIYIGAEPFLMLSNPAELEFLLSSTNILTKTEQYRFLKNWLGTGLLTSTGEKWRKHRKILTPAFHFQILEGFVDIFNKESDVLIEKLEKSVGKFSVNIYPYITLCTLDIICESAMGTSVNAQGDSDSIYVRSVNTMLKMLMKRTFSFLRYDYIYYFSSLYREERAALNVLHNYTTSVIRKRRTEFMKYKGGSATDDFGRKGKQAFLDLMLEYSIEHQMLTDDEIRQEVDTFMFEGHDTTSSAISFILYSLANNTSVQEKAVQEIKRVFADDNNRQASYKDLQDLKYLELVIKESLRMYPSVPFYGRWITEDIKYGGHILPKGLMINVFCHGLHYNPEIYPNPEKFCPERFEAENMKDRSAYSYIPFSAGSRNCIGQKFAMAEMKAVVSNILRHFELFSVPDHKIVLNADVILKSSNGIPVRLQRRT